MNVVAYASANASNTYMAIIMSSNHCGSISIKYTGAELEKKIP
jgi:hypothetical protein